MFLQSEFKRKLEEKDRILSDLRTQQAQKDKLMKQQQEQIEMVTQQLQDLNSFKVGYSFLRCTSSKRKGWLILKLCMGNWGRFYLTSTILRVYVYIGKKLQMQEGDCAVI